MKTYSKEAKAKLSTSCLTEKDARLLGIECLSRQQTKKLFPKIPLAALKFNYFDMSGKKLTANYRVRFLETLKGDFGIEKKLRYLQPKDTPPAAYFPKIVDWSKVSSDTSTTIIITEGELKAACACKYGYKCIGLGGVWSFKSTKEGWSLLPELKKINWRQRDVIICFDSDIVNNTDVSTAAAALIQELATLGANPGVAVIPEIIEGEKLGIDDLIYKYGEDAFKNVIANTNTDELAKKLWKFNHSFVFVHKPGFVYDVEHHQSYEPTAFKNANYANVAATRLSNGSLKKYKVAKEWIEWEQRRETKGITFAPGKELFHDSKLNTWQGWRVEPQKGPIKFWEDLLDYLFTGTDKAYRNWFEQWCFYPIKYPGTKLLTASAFWSHEKGIGKSAVGFTLGKIYGEGYEEIDQKILESDFNGWAVNKQFVMIDDVSSHDSRAKADMLKKFIVQERITVNIKYVPTYSLPDCCNLFLTSNRPNAYYIEEGDRRFFVHEVTAPKKPMQWYKDYHNWVRGPGASALLYYILNDFKFTNFDPVEPPPFTEAKNEMIENARTEIELWLTELRDDPDSKLRIGSYKFKRDLYTAAEIKTFFDKEREGQVLKVNTIGGMLKFYFKRAQGGKILRPNDKSEKFYIIRNEEKWLKADRKQITEHIRKFRSVEQGTKEEKF